MADYADLHEDELESLLRERAEALGGELRAERTEEGDWLLTLRREEQILFGAEAAYRVDALIALADQVGS